jgi:DNA (cytosine-5)-methyltransferase 1
MTGRLLDLYCCEGGASRGYADAGWTVYGSDLFEHTNAKGKRVGHSRKRYPYPAYKGDAIAVLDNLLAGAALPFTALDGSSEWLGLDEFAAISASPPCQHASAGTRAIRKAGDGEYPALIKPTRVRLQQTGLPYVIENVRGADLVSPLELCGCMFDLTALDDDGLPLRMERPRLFESNILISAPRPCYHDPIVWVAGSYGGARKQGSTPAERRHNAKYVRHGGYVPSIRVQQELLGIDWMTQKGMHQSLPPAYTRHLGSQLMAFVQDQHLVVAA